MIGQTLGPYEILALLGKGGMGEVYKARDPKLDREVAIKVLPAEFARDEERLLRFRREAKLLASLEHPHIAAIHGFETVEHKNGEPVHFLVLEYLEGLSLSQRLENGPLPVDEALELCEQIASGLESAHDKGIVHRDLKPGNVMLRPDGSAKILDFGLARAMAEESSTSASAQSPTITPDYTQPGVVLGTAAYMSPEQARGRTVDRRTDIWSFGCVLYECLTGKVLFSGESATESMGAVLHKEPEWSLLPRGTPPMVQVLLRRCLAKDRRRRLQSIGDARVELQEAIADPTSSSTGLVTAAPQAGGGTRRRTWPRLVAFLAVAGIAAALGWWAAPRDGRSGTTAVRTLRAETATNLIASIDRLGGPVLSPDGRHIAFVHQDRLWVRDLASLEARALPDTEGAERPFWPPAADWIGYFTLARGNAAALWKAPVREGPVTFLGRLPRSTVYGATWSAEGRIILSSTTLDQISESRLYSIDAGGGEFSELADGRSPHIGPGMLFPELLPDGETMLAVEVTQDDRWSIVAHRQDQRVELLHHAGEAVAHPVFSPTGHVVYERSRLPFPSSAESEGIWAFRFDPSTLRRQGDPFRISATGFHPSTALDGTLVYDEIEGEDLQQLAWVDRSGALLETVGEPHELIVMPEISPDGSRIAYMALDDQNWDIWLLSHDGSRTRLTLSPFIDQDPAWSPDGLQIAFVSERSGSGDIYVVSASGRGSIQPLVTEPELQFFPEWEHDGGGVLFHVFDSDSTWNIWRQSIGGQPAVLYREPGGGHSVCPQISPDGRFLAYLAAPYSTVGWQIYLSPLSDLEKIWQVSENGSLSGFRWSPKGDAIYHVDSRSNTLLATRLTIDNDVTLRPAQALFSGVDLSAALSSGGRPGFDVTDDGEKFLVVRNLRRKSTIAIWMQNWHLRPGG